MRPLREALEISNTAHGQLRACLAGAVASVTRGESNRMNALARGAAVVRAECVRSVKGRRGRRSPRQA
eukprot:1353206-Pyramimonas_sp.AAC.1